MYTLHFYHLLNVYSLQTHKFHYFFAAKSNNNLSIWSELAMTLLTIVAEGASLGAFLAKFHLSENTVNSLVNLDNKLKPAWMNLMVRF